MPSQKGGGLFGFGSSANSAYNTYTMESGVNSGVLQYVYYFVTITIIALLVLLVVHYTLTPIFRTRRGGAGVIPVPGVDDVTTFWKDDKSIAPIAENTTPIAGAFQNYSYMLDVIVDNPTANTGAPRVLMTRGPSGAPSGMQFRENDTILTLVPNFNTIVYLDRLTNDLNISVALLNDQNQSNPQTALANVVIPNVPLRKAIRVGVMISARVMEVYVNGYLARSVTYTLPVRGITGAIQPPTSNILTTTARVRNLRLWNRILSPAEFRAYGAPTETEFTILPVPDSCVA
jgi:hypothetical protein